MGAAALRQPNGPSYEFFEKLLPPPRYVHADFRYYPIVLSAANAHFLSMLRYLLDQDWDLDDDGRPETLRLLFATPRRWLNDGHAVKVERAIKDWKALPLETGSRHQGGTVHLNSADRHGNMVALTLTHGNAFGACVTVEGLGLILGHGMSRFEPQPNHPSSPGPGQATAAQHVSDHCTAPTLAYGGRSGTDSRTRLAGGGGGVF